MILMFPIQEPLPEKQGHISKLILLWKGASVLLYNIIHKYYKIAFHKLYFILIKNISCASFLHPYIVSIYNILDLLTYTV